MIPSSLSSIIQPLLVVTGLTLLGCTVWEVLPDNVTVENIREYVGEIPDKEIRNCTENVLLNDIRVNPGAYATLSFDSRKKSCEATILLMKRGFTFGENDELVAPKVEE